MRGCVFFSVTASLSFLEGEAAIAIHSVDRGGGRGAPAPRVEASFACPEPDQSVQYQRPAAIEVEPTAEDETPQRRAARSRRAPSRLAFSDLQHAHATLGTGGLKRRDDSPSNTTPLKRQKVGVQGGAGGAVETAVSPMAVPLQAERGIGCGGSFFDHVAEMLILNPSCSITEIEAGPARFASIGSGDSTGNAAVWVRSGQEVYSTCLLVSSVQVKLISSETSSSSMTRGVTRRTASMDRNIMHMLRNSEAQYDNLEHAAAVEAVPMSSDHMLAYDADAGSLYLSEGNQRANFDRVGWSQVAVEGMYSVQASGEGTEDMALSMLGADRPLLEPGYGLPVCNDEDDRRMVKALLTVVRQFHLAHPLQVRICLGSVRAIVELGSSAPLIS